MQIPTLEGTNTSLDQYKGKVVLVNFWATWCAPCRIEIPWLIEFNEKYGPKGLVILGVAMDDEGNKVVQPCVQNQRFDVNGHPEAMNYPDPAGQLQNCRQIRRHSGHADKHALFARRKENQDDRRLDRPRRSFQNSRQSTLNLTLRVGGRRQSLIPGRIDGVTATLPCLRFCLLLVSIFRESDACLVVVAVFKTAAPTLCAGG